MSICSMKNSPCWCHKLRKLVGIIGKTLINVGSEKLKRNFYHRFSMQM